MMSCSSIEEILTELDSSVTVEQEYDSDTFESVSTSVTSTLNDESVVLSNLHNSKSLLLNNSPSEWSALDGEKREPVTGTVTTVLDDEGGLDIKVEFVSLKLQLLRTKLCTLEGESGGDSTRISKSVSRCGRKSSADEMSYVKSSLKRLKKGHKAEDFSSISCRTQNEQNGAAEVFSRQREKLKIEVIKIRMKNEIKRQDEETHIHYQALTCPRSMDQQSVIAEKEFVHRKLKLLALSKFQDKLDKHLYQRDSLSLLGDVVGSCIRPSAPAGDVWKAIADKMLHLQHDHQCLF